MYRSYVMICGGPNCTLLAGRQEKLAEEFEVQLKLAGLRKEVQVMRGGCLGLCSSGPNVAVFPEGTIYSHVHVEDVAEIVSEHLLKGGRVDRLLYNENEAKYKTMASLPSWAKAPVEQVYRELGLAGTGGPGQNTQLDASETYIRAMTVIAKVLEKLDAQP